MTQTVDSRAWSAGISIRPLNFLDVIAPPRSIGKDEFVAQVIRLSKTDVTSAPSSQGWLATDMNALGSVLRGLSEEGRIDRGSFAIYVD
jgi:hypothetical protein